MESHKRQDATRAHATNSGGQHASRTGYIPSKAPKHQPGQRDASARHAKKGAIEQAIKDYLADHEGGNHSEKTLEWHRTALGLLEAYLEQEQQITLVTEVDAS